MRGCLTGVTLALLMLFIAACGSVPRTKTYTIVLPPEEKQKLAGAQDPALAIHVRSARYLQQAYIASRSSPYSLDISRYSKWDTAPDRMVAGALRDIFTETGRFREVEIFNSAPQGYYVLEVNLREFELSDDGGASHALLSMDVSLSPPGGGEIYGESFSRKAKLDQKNFENLARELSLALDEVLKNTRKAVLAAIE